WFFSQSVFSCGQMQKARRRRASGGQDSTPPSGRRCCAAGFRSGLCPLRVKSDQGGPSHATVHVRFALESRQLTDCVGSTRENDFGRGSLSLGQERRSILLFKNEGAARAYGKRIEDTFVSLARNRAGLVTFSIDETNDRSTWGACRARWPSWARRPLRCDLLLFAGSESQR